MRVISGIYKHRRFDIPRTFKARPTTDFAKENLFNVLRAWIDFDEPFTALDLFSGTGSISLEFLSRGASRVVSIEKDRMHYSFIRKCMDEIGTDKSLVLNTDVFKYLQHCPERFDIVFADPPYAIEELSMIPDLVLGKGILKEDGLLVLEHGEDYDFSAHPLFREHRSWGSVNFSLFREDSKA